MNLQGRNLERDLRGHDVALLHRELAALDLRVPDTERAEALFGSGTVEIVTRFQQQHDVAATGVVDPETAAAINAAVSAATYVVEGTISSRARAGVGALNVRAVARGAGGDTVLHETVSDADGAFRLVLVIPAPPRRKRRPDLQARVYRGDLFLGASEVRYNASNHERLDVLLPDTAAGQLPSEHETIAALVADHFRGPLRELKEDDDRQDITYLANKTGWDARAIALAALADQFSARTIDAAGQPVIEPAFFYALFRAGVPADENVLYQTSAAEAARVWTQGIADGIIPGALEARIGPALERLVELGARRSLDGPALAGVSTLKEMLSVSLGDDPVRHRQFAELQARHQASPDGFWQAVREVFGEPAAKRLALDGQLGYLTLNNAVVVRKLHEAAGPNGLADLLALAASGYGRAEKWQPLVAGTPVPRDLPGDTDDEKRASYAELLAAHVRLSFPTAVVAQMVRDGETPVAAGVRDRVHAFLSAHQGRFEIGLQPIRQYVARGNVQVAPDVVGEIARIQRVYQITPSHRAMNILLAKHVDSAYAIVRYGGDEFVRAFRDEVGEADARVTYAKAQQVHHAVASVAMSFLIGSTAPAIGVHSPAQVIDPKPKPPAQGAPASDVTAYATLESLFGEMDYCACEHCRSILSPAAYLVSLLQFLDREPQQWAAFKNTWKADHEGAPYPFTSQAAFTAFKNDWTALHPNQPLPDTEVTPFQVFMSRRPDVAHLQLTCENTNTPLPYIDVVNETLEYFVTHNLSMDGYTGHDTGAAATPDELLASPQFVTDAAYTALAAAFFPPPLPFHAPLEQLRRKLDRFGSSLPAVMEALRTNDDVDAATAAEYGWRDILMEDLRFSRAEYGILTNGSLTLQQLYGFAPAASLPSVLAELAHAKAFTRRLGISYEDLVRVLRTRFVNPNAVLLPKAEALSVTFATLVDLKNSPKTGPEWLALLPAPVPDEAAYGGSIEAWVKDDATFNRVMSIVTLMNPSGNGDPCSFEDLELRYANPNPSANAVRAFEFIRLARFIRLWKKLGWTIEQTDRAVAALYPPDQTPDHADDAVNLQRLDAGFRSLLPRLGIVTRLMAALKVTPKKDLAALLACFAPIDTHGETSLYRQMFLGPPVATLDPAFAEDGFGGFLTDGAEKLMAHSETLRAAFRLTDDEFGEIASALAYDAGTPLTLDRISAIFRRGWLARKLRLSVRELRLLGQVTGVDPFGAPDPPQPPIVQLAGIVNRLRAASLKPVQALYLIWNQDVSGKSAPADSVITAFARTLRAGLAAIEGEFVLAPDPDGSITRARMGVVYGLEATDLFLGLLDGTFVSQVSYSHGSPTLEPPIVAAGAGRLAYDDFRKQLGWRGMLTAAARDALKAVPGVTAAFQSAADALYAANQKIVGAFFVRYPELLPLHDAYVASTAPVEVRRSTLLAALLPELKRRRKRQQALQATSGTAGAPVETAVAALENVGVLHAGADIARPALDDLIAIELHGLTLDVFHQDTATGSPNASIDAAPHLAYAPEGQKLPANAVNPGAAISGIWRGYLEAPENSYYNVAVEADPGAAVTLVLSGAGVPLAQNGAVWSNTAPIELRAGTLYEVSVRVDKVKDRLAVRWASAGRGWEVVPPRYLYPAALVARLRSAYERFLKLTSLGAALRLTAAETAYFASLPAYQIAGGGWANSLPVEGTAEAATSVALLKALTALLDFSSLKAVLSPDDERLLAIVKDPAAAAQAPDGPLFVLTRWDSESLAALLARLDLATMDLADVAVFRRVYDAAAIVRKTGVPVAALVGAALVHGKTLEQSAVSVRDLHAALRARYDEDDWLKVLRPINDEMRGLRRDALVAHILHQMRAAPATAHIDTPDKLYEYLLMDVQMDACMQTSRVRHALSSVQLFIGRTFLNLEPRVPSSVLDPDVWAAMMRYRVWEANRKILLWPENWLEPELRDDMSPFFQAAMSELLQSDITEDRAAAALQNYLSKLEEVAKLEPCGIYYAEPETATDSPITHVIGRTAGGNRKYFYRRREYGSWTPWEPIPLDVEDNPAVPVVWRDRLFLFWLRVLKQPPSIEPPSLASGTMSTEIDISTLIKPEALDVRTEAVLCWSERYNGKWQPAKTSAIDRPIQLDQAPATGPGAFERSLVRLLTLKAADERGLFVYEVNSGEAFSMYNTHSLPVRRSDGGADVEVSALPLFLFRPIRTLDPSGGLLTVKYLKKYDDDKGPSRELLKMKQDIPYRTVDPVHTMQDMWRSPFLFEDSHHVFYVTTTSRFVNASNWKGYGSKAAKQAPAAKGAAPMVQKPAATKKKIGEDAFINRTIAARGDLSFARRKIGPGGSRSKVKPF